MSITDEDMKRYHDVAPQSRNLRIGYFLHELDLVKGRNTGIPDSQWYSVLYVKA